jgi:hypothetical protein
MRGREGLCLRWQGLTITMANSNRWQICGSSGLAQSPVSILIIFLVS